MHKGERRDFVEGVDKALDRQFTLKRDRFYISDEKARERVINALQHDVGVRVMKLLMPCNFPVPHC